MTHALMYSTASCPFCIRAEQLLRQQGISVEKILVDRDPEQLQKMIAQSGRRTVPQIFIDGHYIGGYDELIAWNSSGRLKQLLKAG